MIKSKAEVGNLPGIRQNRQGGMLPSLPGRSLPHFRFRISDFVQPLKGGRFHPRKSQIDTFYLCLM